MRGPSCSVVIPYQQEHNYQPLMSEQLVKAYPSLLQNELNVELEMKLNAYSQISLLDMSGRMIMRLYSADLEMGMHKLNFPIQNLANGSYILNCKIGGINHNFPILILN